MNNLSEDKEAGPKPENWNHGIFRLDGDTLDICLEMNGKPRPTEFCTSPGSGRAKETLKRTSHSRPEEVTGGTASAAQPSPPAQECVGFEFVECPMLTTLQGEWKAVKIVRDGQELPQMMLRTGLRTARKNEGAISFGGQKMIHVLVRLDESTDPMHVDYHNLDGASTSTIVFLNIYWERICDATGRGRLSRPLMLCFPTSSASLSA